MHSQDPEDPFARPRPVPIRERDARVLRVVFMSTLIVGVLYSLTMLSLAFNSTSHAVVVPGAPKNDSTSKTKSKKVATYPCCAEALKKDGDTASKSAAVLAAEPVVAAPLSQDGTGGSANGAPPDSNPAPATEPTPAASPKVNLDEAIAAMEKDEEYFDYCVEQYLRCGACHLPDKKLIGPPLYEVYELYKDNFEGVMEWARKPGKRRPDYPQMLPILVKDKQLRAASLYLMMLGRDAAKKRKQVGKN